MPATDSGGEVGSTDKVRGGEVIAPFGIQLIEFYQDVSRAEQRTSLFGPAA